MQSLRLCLHEGWEFCATPPGQCTAPADASLAVQNWRGARVPTTAAAALRALQDWSLDGAELRFDAYDWWFRLSFDLPAGAPREALLGFDGLATLCEVWLNGETVLRSDNMFSMHVVPVRALRAAGNELHLVFRSLDAALKQKRPRPKWRAPMIENQQLRWHRTTVLGRTPGWSPAAAAVGPWKPVWLAFGADAVTVESLHALPAPRGGQLRLRARLRHGVRVDSLRLQLSHDARLIADVAIGADDDRIDVQLDADEVEHWWPHTHGRPVLYQAALTGSVDGKPFELPLGQVGFRNVALIQQGGQFRIEVNGVDTFCRGACWTPLDIATLRGDREAYRCALEQCVAAGFNMLRISGAFVYEDECFFELCDELGLLVWQEFMFANMDYPATDTGFLATLKQEAAQQLQRWSRHPSVAVICGNSEVSQQAAMWGAARDAWSQPLFEEILRDLTREHCPHTPYWPSSAWGGDFPHQTRNGTSSYYGVGAYLRPVDDLRRSGLRFATESLGFANVPEPETLQTLPGGSAMRVHHPEWKRRAPRDLGAGWDFDDVRDHYLALLFKTDPVQLRYSDHARYLELSRRVPAEVMTAAFAEWRRNDSPCGGALIWFLRDLWTGAGWGIIDSHGRPKAAYYALRRALQARWIAMTDEGLNGIAIHVGNERGEPLQCRVEFTLYRQGMHPITSVQHELSLAPRATVGLSAAGLLHEFHDLTHSYRFGPLGSDLIVATLCDSDGVLSRAFHLPYPELHSARTAGHRLQASARALASGGHLLTLRASGFARSVRIDAPGFSSEDQYFNLLPGEEMSVRLRAEGSPASRLQGVVDALNSESPARIEVQA